MTSPALAADPPQLAMLDDPERVAAAMSPVRLRVLTELRAPDSAAGLARRLGTSRQRLNYHLRALEDQGLLEVVETRQRRGFTERVMRTTAQAFVVNSDLLGTVTTVEDAQDRFSSAYLLAAAARLVGDIAALRAGSESVGKWLATVTEEAEVRVASPAELKAFTEELTEALATLIEKGWEGFLAALRHYVEQHFGTDRRVVLGTAALSRECPAPWIHRDRDAGGGVQRGVCPGERISFGAGHCAQRRP